MAIPVFGQALSAIRRFDRLFETINKLHDNNESLAERLLDLERRVGALENREELLIERMGNRASEAATNVVSANLVDIARRVGILEERSRGTPPQISG